MAYKVGDKVAHPLHGAGIISDIQSKRINGTTRDYYALHILTGNILVLVPVDSSDMIGLRPIVSQTEAEAVFDAIPSIENEDDVNWNKRYRDNMTKIKSGDLLQVASVIKSLKSRETQRGLSTGERKMYHSAKQIFISEIVLAQESEYAEVERRLTAVIS